ncbi:unnamed protein product [Peronospora farinosa]|uniref:Myb-like domain-containing protein n=1 Tax=Peronospora farinosa TaxID=134698 RepID=A0AAV0U207_9STRA|nr:unnamed protein product [Peronospora farinosa]CAI5731011.1 unnamed protein product [Peronospora farinosa]
MSATDSADASAKTDTDTIAGRTRTKFSLVDVPIDTLEASLPLDHNQATAETAEDREYQRFLSSLLPNEQVNLSFLDEEDEEYRPEEEEEEHEEEETRRGISKKELTDLLLDSTHMSFPILSGGTLEPKKDDMLLDTDNINEAVLSTAGTGEEKDLATALKPGNVASSMAAHLPAGLRGRSAAVSQAQCIQLASQMHKHLQLLLQSYHLLTSKPTSPELAECRAMIEELQQRGEKALRYKNTLLLKLNPGTTSGGSEGATVGDNKISSSSDLPSAERISGNANNTENLLALRRVTRSLTAAHAAVAHPSMFELVGSQTVDELSAGFARGCSLEERDRAIKEQMLQLDTHLLSAIKSRKSKKGYSTTEDALLAHGAKRFGTQAHSWDQIRKHFLPTKTTQNLRHRYKYLISPKTGMSAVKALHLRAAPQHHNNSWLLEEDLRIARGLVELHKEKYPFSRLSKSYLPYRSRLEIRKRWERLAAKFRSDLAEIGLTAPDDDSLDLVVTMKEYLEDKLRNRMMRQRGEAEKAKLEAALQLHKLGQGIRKTFMPQSGSNETISSLGTDTQKKGLEASSCRSKNLHPALFFSSWSFISPATLLNATCKHNWPSFMDEDNDADDKLQKSQPSADVADNGGSQFDPQNIGVNDQALAFGGAQTQEFMPVAMPSDLVVVPTTDTGQLQPSVLIDARMAQKESEEEDDDSDYEHDELLSSDNEESESDFEQMEFTDDDDDVDASDDYEASADSFDQDHLMSDSDNQSAASANSLENPSKSLLPSPTSGSWSSKDAPSDSNMLSPRFRHPLRLQNLGQPGNERMKRALAALERRIVGKSIKSSAFSTSTPGSQTSLLGKRAKRKVVSTPLVANQSSNSVSQVDVNEHAHVVAAKTGINPNDDDADDDDDWENGSGDEEFEVVELPSSSDEFSADEDEEAQPEPVTANLTQELRSTSNQTLSATTTSHSEASGTSPNNTLPNKKAKIQECPTCVHSTCTCSSTERMQLLLRRMKEKRSSSSLQ